MDERKEATVKVPSSDPEKPEEEEKKPGQRRDDKAAEDLSEEDLKIKTEVETYVERIQDPDEGVAKLALDSLTTLLRTSTGSVTSIPKPLKFCRSHFAALKEYFEKMPGDHVNTKKLADILALVAITIPKEKDHTPCPALRYKLKGNPTDLEPWGHEFVRYIAHEIGLLWKQRQEQEDECDMSDLQQMIEHIVPFNLRHNGEPSACDLLMETDQLSKIIDFATLDNYAKLCHYLLAEAFYLPHPENVETEKIAFTIFHNLKKYPDALRVAMKLNSMDKIKMLMDECEDMTTKKQMAIMLGRQRIILETDDDTINNLIWNTKLSEFYLYTARDLDSMNPKSPEDVYKTHLQDQRTHLSGNISSHQLNLASTFVNAFVNAGFECDKILTPSIEAGNEWMYKNKEHRMISAAASFGLLYLWDVEEGMNKVDKYLYSQEDYIKAGTLIAMGILHCGVKDECDPAKAIMDDYLSNKSRDLRLGAIVGLGFAYAGSRREEMKESLIPIIADSDQAVEVQAFAALSVGLIFVGSCNEDVSEALIACLHDKDDKQAANPLCRFISLAAGLVFLGSEEGADTAVESSVALNPAIAKFTETVLKICAYAGTGNVVQVQALLAMIAEASGKTEKKDKEKEKDKD
eukprot:Sspe_Gene.1912::Locus_637_Transcript_1_1_Confidence_1.000_Length_1955::g.1912::m.1912/K03028/PSMD2, RPN1; 26S proteasome regulatory subunit N1